MIVEIIMTPELAEICGIHVGDGYLRRRGNKRELDISGSIEEKAYYDSHVVLIFNNLFDLNLKARYFPRGTYGMITHNKEVCIVLFELGFPYGKKSKIVGVPKLILNSENKIFYARFLRGLLDTDGHIGFRKCYGKYVEFKRKYHHYPLINITTISKKLAEEVCFMLNKLRIKHFVFDYQPKNLRDSYKYVITINGIERLNKWMEMIGSKNPVKLSRYLVWKKFGFCPTHTTLKQRESILKGELDIYCIGV